jgi:tetratricopeptide (TPR) repeat protein
MPERTYMVVDPRRDHSFTIPRPEMTAELGVPNACTGCHTDETPQWAASHIEEWHGSERAVDAAAAMAVAGGRQARPDAEEDLIRLASNPGKAGIIRATAMFLLQGYESAESFDAARELLSDSDPLVRVNAIRKLENVSADELVTVLTPLLEDSVRLVRMEAARILAQTSASRFVRAPDVDRFDAFWNALEEYRAGQLALHDQAAAHLNLATIHESLDEVRDAEEAYRMAIRLDSSFVPAHLNLAMLYNRMRDERPSATGRSDSLYRAAEEELRRAMRIDPALPEVHYSLGLLLAEREDRLPDAAIHLARAAELAPDNPRMQYNAGLALQQLGSDAEAEQFLRAAHDLEPSHPDYLNALSVYYAQQERWEDALGFTEQLASQLGPNEAIQQRLAYIRAQMGNVGT